MACNNKTSNIPTFFPGSQLLDGGITSAQGLSTNLARAGEDFSKNSFAASKEQIFSPLEIKNDLTRARDKIPSMKQPVANRAVEQGAFPIRGSSQLSINPNATNLDPYFAKTTIIDNDGNEQVIPAHIISDFSTVVTDTPEDGDGELEDENDREVSIGKVPNTQTIRTIGLRGPMLMSGWGFDIGDKPVPLKETRWISNPNFDPSQSTGGASSPDNPWYIPNPKFRAGDTFKMNPLFAAARKNFLSGPVHLLWDRERQVWSGGLPMLMGVATSNIDAPEDPTSPTEFTIEVLRERGQEALFDEEETQCQVDDDCGDGFVCNPLTGYCEQENVTPFMPVPGVPESITLKNFDPSMSQRLVTRNRERTTQDTSWPDVNCNDTQDCENNGTLPGPSKCVNNKCAEIPPGAHNWLDNPSLVWVLAIKMNYVWIPFYIGCPPECLTSEHCVSLYKDDPNFEDLPGVDSPANWECNDGECVFSG